jgi:hypothetical protein
MQLGAEAVHAAKPNVLVIFSGLDIDNTLSFFFFLFKMDLDWAVWALQRELLYQRWHFSL